jgi:IclR family transcriptional regulator, acetate operon repressor
VESTGKRKRRGRASGPAAAGQVKSLARGLALLERLAECERGVALVDLAQRAGLAASTTHRLLSTLEKMGYVYQAGDLGYWFVGVKTFTVGAAFLAHRDMLGQAHAFLRRLMEESGETANLAVLDDSEAVFVAQVQCREMMRMIVKLGSRIPLHASGVGKALLAAMPENQVSAILHKRGLQRITANTIDTPAALRAALNEVRRRGYAVDNEEHALGLRCIAAPIYDEHCDPLAALSISGPKSRISDERLFELGALVSRTATEITRALGGRHPTGKVDYAAGDSSPAPRPLPSTT